MKTIIVNSLKGGSGKSTLCANLSVEAERVGDGPVYLIDLDPLRALKEWIDAAEITDGPLLRSIDRHGNLGPSLGAQYIADTVKRAAKAAGLNVERLSAHSLRAGAATQAAKRGATRESIKRLGRWKSDVYERYIRFETVWEDAPAARLGM